VLQYRDTIDPKVAKAGIEMRTGLSGRLRRMFDKQRQDYCTLQQAGGSGKNRQGWTWFLFNSAH